MPKTAICRNCQATYSRGRNNGGKFCTQVCYSAYRANHPEQFCGGPNCDCEFCGKRFRKSPSAISRVKRNFCSSKCAARFRSPAWNEAKAEITEKGTPVVCQHCEMTFYARPYNASRRRYCSVTCNNAARFGKPGRPHVNRTVAGENNPNYRATNNRTTARQVAFRHFDQKCLICGFDTVVSVHHIEPKRLGGPNVPENLAVLCPNHHAMADRGMIPAEELFRLTRDAIARRSDHQSP